MALKLIVSASYQRNGNIVNVSVDGTYGLRRSLRSTLGVVTITLVRLLKIASNGPVYVTTTLVKKSIVEIGKDGRFYQDGPSSTINPIIYSEKISKDSFIKAQVIVDVHQGLKLLASEMVYI